MLKQSIFYIPYTKLRFCKRSPAFVFVSTARKESAKEKQLKEEEKILESVAEGRGNNIILQRGPDYMYQSFYQAPHDSSRGVYPVFSRYAAEQVYQLNGSKHFSSSVFLHCPCFQL